MTDKQRKFADEYLIDLNATRAYKAVYPHIKSDRSACTLGGRLLSKVDVRAYIDAQLRELHASKVMTAQEVLEYLSSVIRGESESEVVVIEGQGVGVTEARRMSKAPDEKERLKAAELMAKYHQLLIPKVQVEAEHSGGLIMLQEATDGEP